jgi:hypothetical protein
MLSRSLLASGRRMARYPPRHRLMQAIEAEVTRDRARSACYVAFPVRIVFCGRARYPSCPPLHRRGRPEYGDTPMMM